MIYWAQVAQQEWDALVSSQPEVVPFMKWSFLHILEASGSAVCAQMWP
jgi:predicted N-acyltransferase